MTRANRRQARGSAATAAMRSGADGLEVQGGAHDLPRVGGGAHLVEEVLGPPAHVRERCPGALGVGDAEAGQPAGRGVGST